MLIISAIVIFLFGVGLGWCMGAGYRGRYNYLAGQNQIVDEMHLQRARDYFNNPVVNELKREQNLKQQRYH